MDLADNAVLSAALALAVPRARRSRRIHPHGVRRRSRVALASPDGGPRVWCEQWRDTLSYAHGRQLIVEFDGTIWFPECPSPLTHTTPTSRRQQVKDLPALRCPPLDSWHPEETDAALVAEQQRGLFSLESLHAILQPWVGRTWSQAQRVLPTLYAIAFWTDAHYLASLVPDAIYTTYDRIPDLIRSELETCPALEQFQRFANEVDLFLAPGSAPRTPQCDASAYIFHEYSHPGENGGRTQELYFVTLSWPRRWNIERSLIYRRRRFGEALS